MPPKLFNTSYFRCLSCGKILPESDWNGSADKTLSPCCGQVKSREAWPPPAAQKLITITLDDDLNSQEKLHQAAVFLSFAVELIMENIIINHLIAAGNSSALNGIAAEKGIESLVKAFGSAAGAPMSEKLEGIGAAGFMEDIKQLAGLRSKLMLDKNYPAQPSEKDSVVSMRNWCLKYFALLNNSICETAKPANATAEGGRKGKAVLIVDDELVVLDFMSRIIRRHGINVFSASTGAEGIRLYKENSPDCTFLDMSLPDMDGLSVLKEIKELNPSAVVHMVTGIGGEAIEKEAKKLGTSSYISKPIEAGALLDLVKNI